METTKLSKRIRDKYYTGMPYKRLAKKYNTTYHYVYLIASGVRQPVRGKGLEIKKELEKLVCNK